MIRRGLCYAVQALAKHLSPLWREDGPTAWMD